MLLSILTVTAKSLLVIAAFVAALLLVLDLVTFFHGLSLEEVLEVLSGALGNNGTMVIGQKFCHPLLVNWHSLYCLYLFCMKTKKKRRRIQR